MKKKIVSALKIVLFFAVGIFVFWLAYRGQDFSSLWQAVKSADWIWIVLYVFLALAGHYSRALRWSLLLEPMGYRPKSFNLFSAIMLMYFSNMAVPRSGEFIRCGITSRYENIPFAKSFGTVITERLVDMAVFIILTAVVLIWHNGIIVSVLDENPQIMSRLQTIESYLPVIIISGILLAALCAVFFWYAVKKNLFGLGDKIKSVLKNVRDGVLTVLKIKKKLLFLFHTVVINFMYYLEIYLPFKAFSFTENLTAGDALTVFVLSTYGVVVPSPGGMGTWHFIVIELLALLGVARDPSGRAYALVTHGVQDILFLAGGVLLLFLLPVVNKKINPQIK